MRFKPKKQTPLQGLSSQRNWVRYFVIKNVCLPRWQIPASSQTLDLQRRINLLMEELRESYDEDWQEAKKLIKK